MCENLMDREKAIDFRPHTHNLLCSADTFFDSRYNAHLKLEKVLDNLYTQILHENHLDLATQLAMTIRKTLCSLRGEEEEGVSEASFKKPKREVSFCYVPVSYIVSGLASFAEFSFSIFSRFDKFSFSSVNEIIFFSKETLDREDNLFPFFSDFKTSTSSANSFVLFKANVSSSSF